MRKIRFIVALPPPVHGQSIINSAIISEVSRRGRFDIHISNVAPRGQKKGVMYHATRLVRVLRAASRQLLDLKPGVITYTVADSGYGRLYNALIFLIARVRKSKLFIHHHTAYHTISYDKQFARLSRLAPQSAFHILLSEQMEADFRKNYPWIENTLVIHNAGLIEAPGRSVPQQTQPRQLRLGYLSNISKEKGIYTVLEIFEELVARNLDVTLSIGGPVANDAVGAKIWSVQQQYADRITYLGPLNPAAKAHFFAEVDVFLFPSQYRFEAQPLVVLEAMAHGCALIVSNVGYIAELSGSMNPAHSIADLKSAAIDMCEKMIADPKYGDRIRNYYTARFAQLKEATNTGLQQFYQILENS